MIRNSDCYICVYYLNTTTRVRYYVAHRYFTGYTLMNERVHLALVINGGLESRSI